MLLTLEILITKYACPSRNSGVAKAGLVGHVPGQSTMFVPLMSRNLAQSVQEREANGLAYSKCPSKTNDLAMPQEMQLKTLFVFLVMHMSCKTRRS